ncbi:hypothetical protein AZI86_17100 [Bdellovibrio bacteriovorus]|uniref:Uncharacterized protein n=2 Tax=Bdellovibrio bacteriovorus TaxID=959 RepID=A0A150WF05_BDEBC|nr:hypothetical protein AZI86_17100 [Bdellovibrio bacteriovorus]
MRTQHQFFFAGAGYSQPIAYFHGPSGELEYRPYDSLRWMLTPPNTILRNGDYLRTGNVSALITTYGKYTVIKMLPNSLIRLSLRNGMIHLDVQQGEVQLPPGADVEVSRNSLPPATSSMTDTQNVDVPKAKTDSAKIKSQNLVIKGVQLYPKRNSILLYRKQALISISLPFECREECVFEISLNGKFDATYKRSGFPTEIPYTVNKPGTYQWHLKGLGVDEVGEFEAIEYHKDELQKFLLENRDLDILN